MAAGDITVVGTDKSTESNTTSSTIQWTDLGGGSAPQADDLAIVFVERNSASTDGATLPTNAGMTLVDSQTDGNSLLRCYKKVCTGSETGSITTTTTASARKSIFGILLRGALDVEILTKGADAGTDANHTPPAATPTGSGWGALIAMGEHSGTAVSATPPSGYTEAVEVAITGTAMSFGYLAYKGSAGLLDQLTISVAETPGNIVSNASGTDVTYMTVLVSPIATAAFTGSVALSGSGTITAPTRTPGLTQTTNYTGSGTLAFSGAKPGLLSSAALSGSGTLTPIQQALAVAAALGLTGSGTLSTAGSPKWVNTLGLTGSGTLVNTVAGLAITSTAPLTGAGSLTLPTRIPAFAVSLGLAGSGTLSYAGSPAIPGSAALSGSGTLSTVGVLVVVGTVTLSGSGTLTAAGIPKPITTMGLTGAGTLASSGLPKFISTAGLTGSGTLAADGLAAILASLALSGQGVLSGAGTPSIVGVVVGLSGDGQLTYAPVIGFTGSVALSGSGLLEALGLFFEPEDLDLVISDAYGHPLRYKGEYGYVLAVQDARGRVIGYVLLDEDVEVADPLGRTLRFEEREI